MKSNSLSRLIDEIRSYYFRNSSGEQNKVESSCPKLRLKLLSPYLYDKKAYEDRKEKKRERRYELIVRNGVAKHPPPSHSVVYRIHETKIISTE